MQETPTDEELWRAAIEGAPDAWGSLFLRHRRAVYDYCYRRTGMWGAAEDLTSAVFLEAWKLRAKACLYCESALPWLYGIATMLTRNHERTLRRYRGALDASARLPRNPILRTASPRGSTRSGRSNGSGPCSRPCPSGTAKCSNLPRSAP